MHINPEQTYQHPSFWGSLLPEQTLKTAMNERTTWLKIRPIHRIAGLIARRIDEWRRQGEHYLAHWHRKRRS